MPSNAKKALAAVAAVAVIGLVLCAQNVRWPEAIAGDKDAKTSSPASAEAKAIADAAMAQWKLKNPDRVEQWVKEEKERHKIQPPADNTALLKGEQGKGHTYGNYTERDLLIWSRETEKLVVDGSRIFHSSELLGGTVGVSCDMCHPDAANTHPETYPKFQAQMGRGALLRDMINWCIEHPVRGKALAADDARMRALEAYILAQRKGVKLDYGKH
jgi:cytochrome c